VSSVYRIGKGNHSKSFKKGWGDNGSSKNRL